MGAFMLPAMGRQAAASDTDLVGRARQGDRSAFDRIVGLHLEQVWRVVWRILRHREDTEDVVQEVFLAAHKAMPAYRGEASLSTWLHRIAVNQALNFKRRATEKVRRASLSLADREDEPARLSSAGSEVHNSPLQALEARELQRRLRTCLEQLPALWRSVLALRDGESLSYQEIAQALDTAIGTVRSRLARARLALRRCVEGVS